MKREQNQRIYWKREKTNDVAKDLQKLSTKGKKWSSASKNHDLRRVCWRRLRMTLRERQRKQQKALARPCREQDELTDSETEASLCGVWRNRPGTDIVSGLELQLELDERCETVWQTLWTYTGCTLVSRVKGWAKSVIRWRKQLSECQG